MRSTTIYRRGQVVVVKVPFTGHSGSKPRPALVLSADAFHRELPDLIVCPISSHPRFYSRPGSGDHPLQHWKSLGCIIRALRAFRTSWPLRRASSNVAWRYFTWKISPVSNRASVRFSVFSYVQICAADHFEDHP
jgi:hypothetical protein